jgi:hypothetical protein
MYTNDTDRQIKERIPFPNQNNIIQQHAQGVSCKVIIYRHASGDLHL